MTCDNGRTEDTVQNRKMTLYAIVLDL
jgi:hypothetical protein